jgi:hypothetical protein
MKYVYAIIPASYAGQEYEPLAFASPNEQFEVVADGELAAVVSDSSIAGFGELPRGELMRYLTLHQKAVETLLDGSPVLPVKFGTLLADTDQVRSVLALGRSDIRRAFELVGDRLEVDVAVTWEPANVFAEIAQDPEIAALKTQAEQLPPDQALSARIALGRLVKETFDGRRNQLRDALVAELTSCAARWRLNPVMDDGMVMNVACLVNAAEEEALEDRAFELDQRHSGHLQFRLIGPLPPYSFATVEARVVKPDDVAQAAVLLNLPNNGAPGTFGSSTPEQIKLAYYSQARRYHPDAVGNDPAARAQFVRLTEAYRLMTEIALRVPVSFTGNGAAHILVRVGGPEG